MRAFKESSRVKVVAGGTEAVHRGGQPEGFGLRQVVGSARGGEGAGGLPNSTWWTTQMQGLRKDQKS